MTLIRRSHGPHRNIEVGTAQLKQYRNKGGPRRGAVGRLEGTVVWKINEERRREKRLDTIQLIKKEESNFIRKQKPVLRII